MTTLARKLSAQDVKELIQTQLNRDYDTNSPKGKVLTNVIANIGTISDMATLAELIPIADKIISNSRFLSVISANAGFFSVLLFPVSSMFNIINAYNTGHRFYAYRAIAYVTTAWAFNKPIPTQSARVLKNIQSGIATRPARAVEEYHSVWQETSKDILDALKIEYMTNGISKKKFQIILRALGKNNERELCQTVMRGFENKLRHVEKITWKGQLSIDYPL